VEPGIARGLLERASSMRLDTVPTYTPGREFYCRIAATNAPSVFIGVFSGAASRHIHDYLGCLEQDHESPERLIRQIRAHIAAVDSAAGVSRLLDMEAH
jgi:hypothetical protein